MTTTLTHHKMYHDPRAAQRERLTDHQRELVSTYNQGIADGTIAKEEVPCLCGSEEFDLVATYDRYGCHQPTVLCRRCGLMQSRPRYTEESIFWFYNSDFFLDLYTPGGLKVPSREEFEASAVAREPLRRRATRGLDMASLRSVAEIGCQSGVNLYGFHREGKEVIGCDWGPQMVAFGKSLGMDLRLGSTEQLEDRHFDLIILSHVLEHMRDPVAEVRKIVAHLNDEGRLYIEVPNAYAFDPGDLQSAHLYYFSPATLIRYLAPVGLKLVSLETVSGIHFSVVLEKTDQPDPGDLRNEYAEMRRIIRRSDRRDRLKSLVEGFGLLPLARVMKRLLR